MRAEKTNRTLPSLIPWYENIDWADPKQAQLAPIAMVELTMQIRDSLKAIVFDVETTRLERHRMQKDIERIERRLSTKLNLRKGRKNQRKDIVDAN